MTYDKTSRRLMSRHLRVVLSGLPRKEWTANPADPTTVEQHVGYVTFLHDPWLTEGKDLDFHPLMLTTYEITVTSAWGTKVNLRFLGEADLAHLAGPVNPFAHEFYVDDEYGEWDQLDKLLDLEFVSSSFDEAMTRVKSIIDPPPDFDFVM